MDPNCPLTTEELESSFPGWQENAFAPTKCVQPLLDGAGCVAIQGRPNPLGLPQEAKILDNVPYLGLPITQEEYCTAVPTLPVSYRVWRETADGARRPVATPMRAAPASSWEPLPGAAVATPSPPANPTVPAPQKTNYPPFLVFVVISRRAQRFEPQFEIPTHLSSG